MENVATYSEARSEYTKQLASFVVPAMVTWFQKLWKRTSHGKLDLTLFQTECAEIPRWNQDRIRDEIRSLLETIDRAGCDYMEELMTAVFVAHTKVLTAVRLSTKRKELAITVPKLEQFLHRIFHETARLCWKTPFLFMETGTIIDRQKNVLQIEALASEAITTAVRSLLPVKQILQTYMGEDGDEIEKVDDDAEAPVVPVAAPVAPVAPAVPVAAPVVPVAAPLAPVAEAVLIVDDPVVPPVVPPVAPVVPPVVPVEQPIISIDTEPSVRFSDYDAVFQPGGEPKMAFAPKEDADLESADDLTSGLKIHDTAEVSSDDIEDLDAKDAKDSKDTKTIVDSDIEDLE